MKRLNMETETVKFQCRMLLPPSAGFRNTRQRVLLRNLVAVLLSRLQNTLFSIFSVYSNKTDPQSRRVNMCTQVFKKKITHLSETLSIYTYPRKLRILQISYNLHNSIQM